MQNGTKDKPFGTCALKVLNPRKNEKFKVRFFIATESLTPLLGLDATEKMKILTIHKQNVVNVVEDVNSHLLGKYLDTFEQEFGNTP